MTELICTSNIEYLLSIGNDEDKTMNIIDAFACIYLSIRL